MVSLYRGGAGWATSFFSGQQGPAPFAPHIGRAGLSLFVAAAIPQGEYICTKSKGKTQHAEYPTDKSPTVIDISHELRRFPHTGRSDGDDKEPKQERDER